MKTSMIQFTASARAQSAIAKESHRVNAMHGRVTGDYHDAHGRQSTYQARDPRLLLWVHIAFTESFLTAFQEYSGRHVDANQYVAQWARAVEPLGLSTAPRSWQDLQEAISGFDVIVQADQRWQHRRK